MFKPFTLGCATVIQRAAACVREAGLGAWLGALGVGVLLVVLRWNSLDAPLVRDEGEYAYAAQILKRGLPPYEHAFLQKPPMAVYTYGLAGVLAPDTFWFPRVLAGLSAGLAACLLGLIARLEFGRGFALPAMWLATPMLLCPRLWQFTANTEMFMVLPLLATVAVYVLSRHGDGGLERAGTGAWFLAGLLGATTFWYKYTALPVLTLVVVAWSFEQWRITGSGRGVISGWLAGIGGAGIATLAILAPFLASDGGKHLWECTVHFNRFYRASATFGLSGLWAWMEAFWVDWWVLFLLTALLVVRPQRRVWFWMGMFLAAWVSTGASALGQYYVVVMPFWALLTAVAINQAAALAAKQMVWSEATLRRAFTVGVVALVCLPDLPWIRCAKEQFAVVKAGGGNPSIESLPVARRLAELTSPNDLVFVAGSEPQILFYAKRVSASRFVIVYPLIIPTPLARGYQVEAMRELEKHPPTAIVLAQSPLSWMPQKDSPVEFLQFLEKLLAEHYERVGGWVTDAQGSRWQEPLAEPDQPKASLVLFHRKAG
jgi:hypothetical protein